jgi:hypothetical protein
MIDYYIDLSKFPQALHRIVKAWYRWQAVYLHKEGTYPQDESAETIPWGSQPPTMTNDGEFCFIDDGELSYYLVTGGNNEYYIDKQSRASRGRYWMFRRFEDAEKYMLFLITQMVRPGKYSDSPSFRWYREGLDPQVTLTKLDPTNHPGRVSITVNQEATDRGWMTEHNAIAGSHVIVHSFEELDSILREGIPADWFTVDIRSD